MITEQQLNNFKGMRDYGKLEGIRDQLMTMFNELYDMEMDNGRDTQDAKNNVIRALNSVRILMVKMES